MSSPLTVYPTTIPSCTSVLTGMYRTPRDCRLSNAKAKAFPFSIEIIDPNSVEDIGCIHTSQGLELDYVGVIIGPYFKLVNGVLTSDPAGRAATDVSLHGYKKEFKEDPESATKKADQIIRNTYRTLMTRGMKGCYIYCTDEDVAEYFRKQLARLVMT